MAMLNNQRVITSIYRNGDFWKHGDSPRTWVSILSHGLVTGWCKGVPPILGNHRKSPNEWLTWPQKKKWNRQRTVWYAQLTTNYPKKRSLFLDDHLHWIMSSFSHLIYSEWQLHTFSINLTNWWTWFTNWTTWNLTFFPVAFYQDWVQGDTPPPQPCGLFCMYCCKTEGPEGIFWGQAKTHFGWLVQYHAENLQKKQF